MPKEFYMLIRIFRASGTMTHSVQYFNLSDYESQDACFLAATARYHNILSADLQNESCDYNACFMITDTGVMIKGKNEVYDRRVKEEIAETPEEVIE